MSNTKSNQRGTFARILDEIKVWIACRNQRRVDSFISTAFGAF